MWDQYEDAIRAEVAPGEQLLWAGQPPHGLMLRDSDASMIPFSLLWGGFAIFWETGAILGGAPLFFMLWGVPFVLVGLYLIVGRFFVDALQRDKTYYGVTSERVIIVSGWLARKVKSLDLETLTDVSLTERASGAGTITFGPTPTPTAARAGNFWPGTSGYGVPCFELSGDARHVYEIIREAQRATKQWHRGAAETAGADPSSQDIQRWHAKDRQF